MIAKRRILCFASCAFSHIQHQGAQDRVLCLAGDELLITFSASLTMPQKERQEALGSHFQCDCERCELETDGSLPSSVHRRIKDVQAFMSIPGGIMDTVR